MYIVKLDKSLVGGRGKKKKSSHKGNDSLSFEIWIFRYGQPDCDDDLKVCVTITSN